MKEATELAWINPTKAISWLIPQRERPKMIGWTHELFNEDLKLQPVFMAYRFLPAGQDFCTMSEPKNDIVWHSMN